MVIPVLADPLVFVIALAIVKLRPQGFITSGEALDMTEEISIASTMSGVAVLADGRKRPDRRRLDRRCAGGWVLRAERAHAAGSDQDGHRHRHHRRRSRRRGNANWQVAQFTVEQINKAGGIARPADRALPGGHRVRSQDRRRQRPQADPGAQGRRRAGRHHQRRCARRSRTRSSTAAARSTSTRSSTRGRNAPSILYCTGPTPAQQCDKLIPYLIKTRWARSASPCRRPTMSGRSC